MDIDGCELAIRQGNGLAASATVSATASPAAPETHPPPADVASPPPAAPPAAPPAVALVAAGELREDQPWKPTPFNPGPSFKTLEWSADGTTVVALTASKTVLSYVLPTDLLAPEEEKEDDDNVVNSTSLPRPRRYRQHTLQPQGRLRFGAAPASVAPAPYFSLATPWTQTALVGCPDKPLQLLPLFPGNENDGMSAAPIATYSLIKPETEAYMTPFSLLWPSPGTHFVVGTKSLLALFDVSRTSNDPPLLRVPTMATLYAGAGYGLGVVGNVSALAASPAAHSHSHSHSLTAAGTWTRGVGLYDLARAGSLASNWNLRDTDPAASCGGGGGVVQLLWSPCGRYLVVNERKSSGLLVYDVRGTHRLLATLTGRSNKTALPIRCTVYGGGGSSEDGDTGTFELWSGTDSGEVVMYDNIGKAEGLMEPTFRWQAHDDGTSVASTAMHASGSVVATCGTSPPVDFSDSDSSDSSDSDSNDESESDSDSDGDSSSGGDDGDDGDESEDDDDADSDDSEDSDDDSEYDSEDDSSGSEKTVASPAAHRRQPRIADPSLRIWSLVPLPSD